LKIKVIGLGSPLRGDDGLGVAAIHRLKESGDIPDQVDLIEGGLCGIGLLDLVEGADAVVLIDAVQADDSEPGTIIRVSADRIRSSDTPAGSIHEFRVGEVLSLAESLGIKTSPMTLVGMVPEDMAPQQELSATVESKMPRLVDAVMEEVHRVIGEPANNDK